MTANTLLARCQDNGDENGNAVSIAGAVPLNNLLRQVVMQYELEAQRRQVLLTLSLPSEELTVRGDTIELAQIFFNLLHNALKFTPKGGRIDLRLTRIGNEIAVEIRDTGCGISKKHLATLFLHKNVKGNENHETRKGNGLLIVKMLTEKHGGHVTVESAQLHGSLFRVHFPSL